MSSSPRDGRPVADVCIGIERYVESTASRHHDRRHIGRSDATGRFTIDGVVEPELLSLVVVRGNGKTSAMMEAPLPFERGATDVRVVVRSVAKATLVGSLILPEGVPPSAVAVWLQGEVAEPSQFAPEGTQIIDIAADGTFRRPVRLGRGRLLVHLTLGGRLAARHEPLVIVENVIVGPEGTDDPRLKNIDLTGLVHRVTVRATDTSGRPLPKARVISRPTRLRDGGWIESTVDDEGHVRLFRDTDALEVRVGCAGYREGREAKVTSNTTFALVEATRLVVEVARDVESPVADLRIELRIQKLPTDEQLTRILAGEKIDHRDIFPVGERFARTVKGNRRRFEAPLSRTGRYDVQLAFVDPDNRRCQVTFVQKTVEVNDLDRSYEVAIGDPHRRIEMAIGRIEELRELLRDD